MVPDRVREDASLVRCCNGNKVYLGFKNKYSKVTLSVHLGIVNQRGEGVSLSVHGALSADSETP